MNKIMPFICIAVGALFMLFHGPLGAIEHKLHARLGVNINAEKIYKISVFIIGLVSLLVGLLFLFESK
jgi:hypothetical protein